MPFRISASQRFTKEFVMTSPLCIFEQTKQKLLHDVILRNTLIFPDPFCFVVTVNQHSLPVPAFSLNVCMHCCALRQNARTHARNLMLVVIQNCYVTLPYVGWSLCVCSRAISDGVYMRICITLCIFACMYKTMCV